MTPPPFRRLAAVGAGLALALTLGWSAPAGAGQPAPAFTGALDRLLADPRLDGALAGVVVRDADTGATLYDHDGDTRLMPASNTKLLTSAAAMDVLGPGYRYRTDLVAAGTPRRGVLRGDLYLRGSGDPTMLAADYAALAADLAASGVTTVRGDLVADDTRFDATRLGRAWSWDNEADYYSAQISALTLAPDTDYDAGTVYVSAAPGPSAGDPPTVTLTPPNDWVTVDNRATTAPAGSTGSLSITRQHGTNTLVVSGRIAQGAAPATSWTAVDEPTGYAASVLADALAAEGVRVTGDVVLGRATPPDAGQVLASHASMPLSELLVPFMKLSNNMHAEALVKTMGYETAGRGTWRDGLAAVRAYADRIGVDTGAYSQVDGSGLSRMSVVPPAELAALLTGVRAEPWFGDWYAALPVACEPDRFVGGTMRSRLCGTPAAGNARAKTGSLTGATGLSGYVTAADGRELAFSVVLNNYLSGSPKDIEDAIVVALASPGTSPETSPGSPPRPAAAPEDGAECAWLKPAAVC
ncbi:D-alanyl-D-alanine carboxypeptidase/D-alanyl-D-alanine-endopeptidase [Streptomyces sp. NPDC049879]|uniref:D-alanyl-D-alanine carboxypeptidase/D-alanyl-D-alanine endopeptidase n=1 Tax=Streptomyces sp. NPDC049879 TaxID=3365598 RepID=UPI00379114F9